MPSFLADLRYSLRELRRRPGFALTAILSLALGIGATSAMFSVVYGVLITPFPYVGAERMTQVGLLLPSGDYRYPGMSGAQLDELGQLPVVESVVGEGGWNLTTTDGGIPEDVVASYVTPNAPNHWGVAPIMGRWLVPADALPGHEPEQVVVLGHAFWQRYYSGDPAVVGRTIQLVRKNYRIVGVMPPRFKWRDPAEIYLPLQIKYEPNNYYGVNLKIRPGVSMAEANAALQPMLEGFARQTPERYPTTFRVTLRSIIDMYAWRTGAQLLLLLGAVGSLLLIGCANVSILLLVRGAHRQQELAVRAAIGAARGRIVRQLLTESVAIAAVGNALGLLIAWKGLALILRWLPPDLFASESIIQMNVPVLVFSTALALITTVVFGVWPAMQLSRPDVSRVMQSSTRRVMGSAQGKRTHRVLIGVQVALTVLLLAVAGAAGKGFLQMNRVALGYDPHNIVSLPIPVHDGAHTDWQDRAEYFERIRATIADMPQVVSAAISSNATPPANGSDAAIVLRGSTGEKPIVRSNFISPDYFAALQIPMTRGRLWSRDETMRGAAVAVVNETMARQFWPKGDAIGQQIRFNTMKDEPPYSPASAGSDGWIEIIGIAADARNDGLRNPIKPAFYVPYALKLRMFTQILVRARVPPLTMLGDLRAQVARVDPEQQVMRVRDLDAWITESSEYRQQKLVANLFGIFSGLAMALSAIGLYSVVSYGVATRTNEFGIRMALGAKTRDVVGMVLSGTTLSVGGGLVAGIVLCLVFDKFAAQWVTESSRDPVILGSVTAVLVAVAALACIAPIRRATSIDPMEAVRHD